MDSEHSYLLVQLEKYEVVANWVVVYTPLHPILAQHDRNPIRDVGYWHAEFYFG